MSEKENGTESNTEDLSWALQAVGHSGLILKLLANVSLAFQQQRVSIPEIINPPFPNLSKYSQSASESATRRNCVEFDWLERVKFDRFHWWTVNTKSLSALHL